MRKTIFKTYGLLLLFASLFAAACSDWTENAKIPVEDPVFGADDPELYARYLASLRAYKAEAHRQTIVWFDNAQKRPSSRGGFFSDVPDSVDVVALMASGPLTDSERAQVEELRRKGTSVIGAFDCSALLAAWETTQHAASPDGDNPSADGFAEYLEQSLGRRIDELLADRLDGLTICYEAEDPTFMTDAERALQAGREAVVVAAMKRWAEARPDGLLFFEGTPQYVADRSVWPLCDRLVVRCLDAVSVYEFGTRAMRMCVEGVPTDRFVWMVSAVKPSSVDCGYLTGPSGESVRAIGALAEWLLLPDGMAKNGLGIMNVQYDYYNSTMIYSHVKEAVETLNPAPKN